MSNLPNSSVQVWNLRVNVHVLDHDGNLMDACCLGALSALCAHRRPEVEVDPETRQVIKHTAEVSHYWPGRWFYLAVDQFVNPQTQLLLYFVYSHYYGSRVVKRSNCNLCCIHSMCTLASSIPLGRRESGNLDKVHYSLVITQPIHVGTGTFTTHTAPPAHSHHFCFL